VPRLRRVSTRTARTPSASGRRHRRAGRRRQGRDHVREALDLLNRPPTEKLAPTARARPGCRWRRWVDVVYTFSSPGYQPHSVPARTTGREPAELASCPAAEGLAGCFVVPLYRLPSPEIVLIVPDDYTGPWRSNSAGARDPGRSQGAASVRMGGFGRRNARSRGRSRTAVRDVPIGSARTVSGAPLPHPSAQRPAERGLRYVQADPSAGGWCSSSGRRRTGGAWKSGLPWCTTGARAGGASVTTPHGSKRGSRRSWPARHASGRWVRRPLPGETVALACAPGAAFSARPRMLRDFLRRCHDSDRSAHARVAHRGARVAPDCVRAGAIRAADPAAATEEIKAAYEKGDYQEALKLLGRALSLKGRAAEGTTATRCSCCARSRT
jgi:hypothetical protein